MVSLVIGAEAEHVTGDGDAELVCIESGCAAQGSPHLFGLMAAASLRTRVDSRLTIGIGGGVGRYSRDRRSALGTQHGVASMATLDAAVRASRHLNALIIVRRLDLTRLPAGTTVNTLSFGIRVE
jgi:hypothetical protein